MAKMDITFSHIIRIRDHWTCVKENCQKHIPPPTRVLQCSHFFSKGSSPSVRYDEENADALCYSCHSKHGDNKAAWYREFKIKQLGERRYKLLELRANSTPHRSLVEMYLLHKVLKQRLAQLQQIGQEY